MADFKRLDKMEQFKVTNAVQKAANLALVSEEDRSKILADQLATSNVPCELTKLATDAFNRRISVVTLGKRTDENKAEDFPLADFHKVAALRGYKVPGVTKTASVNKAQYVFSIQKPTMQKAASAPAKEEVPDMSIEQYMKKVESLLDIAASQLQADIRNINQQQEHLDHILTKSASLLNKDTKTSKILSTVYGDSYTELYKDRLPQEALKKHASYAILPKSIAVEMTQKAIHQADLVKLKRDMFMLKKAKVQRMAQAAEKLQAFVSKGILSGMIKSAAGRYSLVKDIAGNMVSAPLMAAVNAGAGALSQADRSVKSLSEYLNRPFSQTPADYISPKLINADLYEDKKQRLIDMLANPQFAKYRAQEIEKAVQDSLQDQKSLIMSGNRGFLKSDVATRLLSDNRTNKADQAATAKLLHDVAQTKKILKQTDPMRTVEALQDKKGGGNHIMQALNLGAAVSDAATKSKSLFTGDVLGGIEDLANKWEEQGKEHARTRFAEQKQKMKDLQGYIKARRAALNEMALSNLKTNRNLQRQLRAAGINWKNIKDLDQLTLGQQVQLNKAFNNYFEALPSEEQERLMGMHKG